MISALERFAKKLVSCPLSCSDETTYALSSLPEEDVKAAFANNICISERMFAECIANWRRYSERILDSNEYDRFLFFEDRELAFDKGVVFVNSYPKNPFYYFDCSRKEQDGNITFIVAFFRDGQECHQFLIKTSFLPQKEYLLQVPEGDEFSHINKKGLFPYLQMLMLSFCEIQRVALRKKEVIKKAHAELTQTNSTKIKNKNPKNLYVCDLNNDISYRYKIVKREDVRRYIRHCEAWTVRGHYRTLKSGKQIFIKPFTKGKGRISKKIYTGG